MISWFIFKTNNSGLSNDLETYFSQLTNSLVKYHEVNVYLVNYYDETHKELTINSTGEGIFYVYVPSPIFIVKNNKQKQKYATSLVNLLIEVLKKEQNVVCQVNDPTSLPIVKELKSKFNFPIISVVHSLNWQLLLKGNKQKFIQLWADQIACEEMNVMLEEKEFYELVDKIVSVTNYMKDFIIKYFNIPSEKISVIYNGVDGSYFCILDNEEKIRLKRKLGFRADEKLILFSGSLEESKGIKFLLDGFKEVVLQNENIRLIIIGEGSGHDKSYQYLKHCENIWGKVTFTGIVKHEKLLKFYQIADIGIIPSVYDHCPYGALEMMGYNIPLIISNTEGLNEILTEKQSIYLNPLFDDEGNISFDKNEISEAIISLVKSEEKIEFITRDYAELIRTRFSGKRMADELYAVFKSLCLAPVEL